MIAQGLMLLGDLLYEDSKDFSLYMWQLIANTESSKNGMINLIPIL